MPMSWGSADLGDAVDTSTAGETYRPLRSFNSLNGPRPWQSKALSSGFPLESKTTCFGGLAESQSITMAAQDNGPLPSEGGRRASASLLNQ